MQDWDRLYKVITTTTTDDSLNKNDEYVRDHLIMVFDPLVKTYLFTTALYIILYIIVRIRSSNELTYYDPENSLIRRVKDEEDEVTKR
jgi:hypothetical protein